MDLKSLISILTQYSTIKLRGSSKAKGTQVTLPQTIHDCLTNQGETEKDATVVLKKILYPTATQKPNSDTKTSQLTASNATSNILTNDIQSKEN